MQGGLRFWPRLPIPRGVVPEDRRARLFAHQFLQGVAELEPLAASSPETVFAISWPADAIALYGNKIYHDMACLEAHIEVTPHMIAGVLDAIRNRVLTFALEIWKEAPDAGEALAAGQVLVSPRRVDQLFNTYILAPTTAVTVGDGEITQTLDVSVTPGDFESLRLAFTQLGVAASDIEELERALSDDGVADGAGALGPATARWLDRFQETAGTQAVNLASGVTAGVLTEALMRFVSYFPRKCASL
jgi:hypothetical protein